MNIIRKIAVGPDYMKCMNYMVGQQILDKTWTIDTIRQESDGNICIWIKKDGEILKWKAFSNAMPIAIEYKIDY